MADQLSVGDPVTLAWYTPGEPWYPRGRIVEPAAEDLARLREEGGTDDGSRVLVHWRSGNWRRWELRSDLRRDDTAPWRTGCSRLLPCQRLGVWRSLVACFVRDEEVAGSDPVTPTIVRGRHRRLTDRLVRVQPEGLHSTTGGT